PDTPLVVAATLRVRPEHSAPPTTPIAFSLRPLPHDRTGRERVPHFEERLISTTCCAIRGGGPPALRAASLRKTPCCPFRVALRRISSSRRRPLAHRAPPCRTRLKKKLSRASGNPSEKRPGGTWEKRWKSCGVE